MTPFILEVKRVTQWEKLLSKILSLSKDIRFDELRKVLESYGYVMHSPKGGSSHYTFRKCGKPSVTIPKHESIKKVYVEMVRKIIEEEELEKQTEGRNQNEEDT